MWWDDVVGQEDAIDFLRFVAARDLPQGSFLLAGPRGTGKRFLAKLFAKAILCEGEKKAAPCGDCRSCGQFEHGNHPDFRAIEAGDDQAMIKVERVRALEEQLSLKTVQSRSRVVLVAGADKMNDNAANAFLKTLEEPPKGTVIILTTSRSSELLPTIISRCVRINVKSLSPGVIEKVLVEKYGFSASDANMRAAAAGGSVGAALDDKPRNKFFSIFIREELPRLLGASEPGAVHAAAKAMLLAACKAEGVKSEGHAYRNMIADFLPLVGECLRSALRLAALACGPDDIPEVYRAAAEKLAGGGAKRIEAAAVALSETGEALSVFVRPDLCVRHTVLYLAECSPGAARRLES